MRLNVPMRSNAVTHEGGQAFGHMTSEQALRRCVMSCMLWESEFYEDGVAIAERVEAMAREVSPAVLSGIAVEARNQFNLRHVPLLLLTVLAKTGRGTSALRDAIPQVVKRADELSELLAIYWRNGRSPLSAQMKKGLADAFKNFDAYQLAKYNRDGAVKLRDVMFMVHPKPGGESTADAWRKLAANELESPDTWEVALSAGADKKETFERLLREGMLGYLALLRNLRGMTEAGVNDGLIRESILARKGAQRVLPFRYIAAARACPQMEPVIDQALSEAIAELPPMSGKTVVLVDVSGSMDVKLSSKSDLTRMDAAAALASIIHGDLRVFTFSSGLVEVPPRRGMAGVDSIIKSQNHWSTELGGAVDYINKKVLCDRLIVITDEQSVSQVPSPKANIAYMINVASAKNGVGYGRWTHIDGFSEGVLRFIHEHERARTD